MLIVWVIFSFACGANSKQKKSYFEKIQFDCDYINSGKDRYYRIIQNKDSKERTFADICLYQFDFSLSTEKEKLAMIKELLLFKGDTDNCSIMVKGYNIQSSQIIPDYFKTYSIQVEALFIINHIIFGNPYNYSPYPVLKKSTDSAPTKEQLELAAEAYKLYEQWFDYASRTGFNKTINSGIYPMKSGDPVYWY